MEILDKFTAPNFFWVQLATVGAWIDVIIGRSALLGRCRAHKTNKLVT